MRVLENDVVCSKAFATEEVERFTFRMPGQAVAYFDGFDAYSGDPAGRRKSDGNQVRRAEVPRFHTVARIAAAGRADMA